MKIVIGAIGHLKTGPEKDMAADYETRILATGRAAGITGLLIRDWPESRADVAAKRKQDESLKLQGLRAEGLTVVMDETGKAMSSTAFADWLKRAANTGQRQVTFLIGGPDGHDAAVKSSADLVLSFGPMTFPHRLIRVMLLEQLYRALTIITNHPYHRS